MGISFYLINDMNPTVGHEGGGVGAEGVKHDAVHFGRHVCVALEFRQNFIFLPVPDEDGVVVVLAVAVTS